MWNATRAPRGIVFCQTIEHADALAELLRLVIDLQGVETVHNGLTKRKRQQALLRFRSGTTRLLTSVDLLNEGIDVPDVNIIVFARVTHSRRIFSIEQRPAGCGCAAVRRRSLFSDRVSDLRRIAEVSTFRAQVEAGETEILNVSR